MQHKLGLVPRRLCLRSVCLIALCSSTVRLFVAFGFVGALLLWQAPAAADYLYHEDELRNHPEAAVVPEWLAPGHYASREEVAAKLPIFAPFGACDNFVRYSQEITISVDDHLETEWATRTPVVSDGHNYSREDRGFWFTKLKYIFKPGRNIELRVFYWNRTFINRVCGNFTPTLICPNLPPVAVAQDKTVEQDRREGAPVLLDASGSSDPDGDALRYKWVLNGVPFVDWTNLSQVTRILPLGRHVATLTVDDGQNHTADATATLTVVDTTPPALTVPTDITVEQATRQGTPVSFTVSAADICDASPQITSVPASGSVFPLGRTVVTATAVDVSGNRTQGTFSVTVVDTTPPVLDVPDDITVEQATRDGTVVEFEVTATDICDADPDVVSDPPSGTKFPLGTTKVACRATDDSGNTTTGAFYVTVQDTTPPSLSVAVSEATLWPPYHGLIDVGLSIQLADICDHDPDLTISVTQDEPVEDQTGDGNFSPDAKLLPAANGGIGSLLLRAERKGDGDGRVYLIIIEATDDSGNSTKAFATVTVSHSQSDAGKAAVAAQAAAALQAGVPLAHDSFAGPIVGPKQ